MVADFHAQAIATMKSGHLACVFSRNKANAERIADAYGCKGYASYSEFLGHKGLDIITIPVFIPVIP